MPRLPRKLAEEIQEFSHSRLALVHIYEDKQQHETAYLARWAILEKFVKTVVTEYRRELLKHSLIDWLGYVNGQISKKPSKQPQTRLLVTNLPEKRELINALNFYGYDGAAIWRVMDSEGKPRGFRNQIAHTGRQFTSERQYRKLSELLKKQIEKVIETRPKG